VTILFLNDLIGILYQWNFFIFATFSIFLNILKLSDWS